MRKVITTLICCFVLLLNTIPIQAKEKIKVAFPIQSGLTELTQDGEFTGYTYDYLKELERFTNFEFEFVVYDKEDVNDNIVEAMDDVAKGKVDIMGGMVYSESMTDTYDYTATNYGTSNMVLYVTSDNAELNETSIYSAKELTAGVVSTKKVENKNLTEFGETNGIKFKQVFYSNIEDMIKGLQAGKIDAMVGTDLSILSGNYRIIAKFFPRSFYFVTTKGKTSLISKLNSAMMDLNKEQPNFMSELHEEYFSMKNVEFNLTELEEKFVKDNPVIDVAVLGGKAPYQSKDSNGNLNGITIELLDNIGKLSGLKFHYDYAETYDEYQKLLAKKTYLIQAGVTYPYSDWSQDYSLSKSFLEANMSLVINDKVSSSDLKGKKQASIKGLQYNSEFQGEIEYYESTLEAFKAVMNQDADYAYINSYIAEFYNSYFQSNDISILPQEKNHKQNICFSIHKSTGTTLLSIINKGIDASSYKMQDIIFRNATYVKDNTSFSDYVKNNPEQFLLTITIILGLSVFFRYYMNKKNSKKILREYERFQQISDLSKDCFIEYNVKSDCLTLSGGGAKLIYPESTYEQYIEKKAIGYEQVERCIQTHKGIVVEEYVSFVDGSRHWLKIILQPILDDNGHVNRVIGKATDIQSEKEEQLLWKELAQKDGLTNLYNSSASREQVEKLLKDAPDNAIALMIIDVDNFKNINDQYGHYSGDLALQRLAQVLSSVVYLDDIVGRVGGDEFIIAIIEPQSEEVIFDYYQSIINKLEQYDDILTTISIGVAFSKQGMSYDDIYRKADNALYDVKNHGRNGCRIANDL
ncbi:MAG: GGDEF domain-containing protein [Coprobacillus cateniformis]|uniref:diguanylate cyclase domain-containing protein n=1 Tax=Longibaculum muris TaxID=1796628 RepID=UPI003AB259C9|nr:GGDEF domain-containing protein [Coprobacillus cateniformis]